MPGCVCVSICVCDSQESREKELQRMENEIQRLEVALKVAENSIRENQDKNLKLKEQLIEVESKYDRSEQLLQHTQQIYKVSITYATCRYVHTHPNTHTHTQGVRYLEGMGRTHHQLSEVVIGAGTEDDKLLFKDRERDRTVRLKVSEV